MKNTFCVLALLAAATMPASALTTLFEGARVIPGDGSTAIDNAAILVERSMISRIGRKGEVALPPGGTRINLDGKTVMPAIISTHVHPGFQKGLSYAAQNYSRATIMDDLNRELYFGVSTVQSLGVEQGEVLHQIRAEQVAGKTGGAQVLLAGRGIGAPNAGPGNPIYAHFAYSVTTDRKSTRLNSSH